MSTAWGAQPRSKIIMALLGLFAAACGAQASDVGALVSLKGECVKLVAGGKDMTGSCGAAVASNTTADGRVMFIFSTGDGGLLSIVGTDLPNPAPDRDAIRIVNSVTKAAGAGNAPVVKPASGTCTFGDPTKGPITIECRGKSSGKPLEAVFRTAEAL